VRLVPVQLARFDLTQGARGRLPAALDVSDPAGAFADLIQWTWEHTVRSDWPRRKRRYEADIVSRTTVLSQRGWAAAVDGIAADVRWLNDGQLQITVLDRPPFDRLRHQSRCVLGPTRAEILLLIGQPITTTQLAAVTGLALGTVGGHLRILTDAGLAERHRSGAHVLYQRTSTGQLLAGLPVNDHHAP
jgi:DNA-binding transcriptional ArsR family regulator